MVTLTRFSNTDEGDPPTKEESDRAGLGDGSGGDRLVELRFDRVVDEGEGGIWAVVDVGKAGPAEAGIVLVGTGHESDESSPAAAEAADGFGREFW